MNEREENRVAYMDHRQTYLEQWKRWRDYHKDDEPGVAYPVPDNCPACDSFMAKGSVAGTGFCTNGECFSQQGFPSIKFKPDSDLAELMSEFILSCLAVGLIDDLPTTIEFNGNTTKVDWHAEEKD